ncbi:hypothetical protein RBU49_08755 [Clostridium sp. MB40-C1]|uniref:hypothetical protein n=1 Tax=Clostridium sp. MB40-C1 TaxID=3070996 RepID=UPI0027DEE02E|nr:hypothetical protein [Clostridium sp. MB40-C1]WMJ82319.1 hypothetical protein RBU49_08755 [Clostridium sp. MB40-C1]
MKLKKIFLGIIMIVILVYGLLSININMNRQIYSSLVNDYMSYEDDKKTWDINNMVEAFNNVNNVNNNNKNVNNVKEIINGEDNRIPKFRVLFNPIPFDFRIDTNKYVFYINKDMFSNEGLNKGIEYLKNKVLKLIEVIHIQIKKYIGIIDIRNTYC